MSRLPPTAKLSLAVRKNVRDEWDNNKADLEDQLSQLLGETWTTDINPLAIWPYHNEGYAKDGLGNCIRNYVEGAIYHIKSLCKRYATFAKEVNTICHTHVLTLDVEENKPPRFDYGGCDVQDGKLRILFVERYLGVNIDSCLQESTLLPALNAAPHNNPMSFSARLGVQSDYEPAIAVVKSDIAELLCKNDDEVKLIPNFEDTFAKLKAASQAKDSNLRADWETTLGDYTLKYFQALAYHMKYIKVGEDELVREGFLEAVSKCEMVFRIVDKLSYDSYCEVVVDNDYSVANAGVLYLQTVADRWGTNIDYVASGLMDQL